MMGENIAWHAFKEQIRYKSRKNRESRQANRQTDRQRSSRKQKKKKWGEKGLVL